MKISEKTFSPSDIPLVYTYYILDILHYIYIYVSGQWVTKMFNLHSH